MKKVLCFGELLMRFPLASKGGWTNGEAMQVFIGGAELNVATALAKWQQPVKYFTALPNNFIAKDILQYLQAKNIDSSAIQFSGDRIGVYYLNQGQDIKSASTVFDRKNSSFATLPTNVVDWAAVFKDIDWFHFSAIAAAVSEQAAALCLEALQAASKKNITISVDLNYRALLWKYGKKPIEVMPNLVKYCNVIMGNIWAANTMLGTDINTFTDLNFDDAGFKLAAKQTAATLLKSYPRCKVVANTFRFDNNSSGVNYYATIDNAENQFVSSIYSTETVVDKVGSGDCFMAGLIYGLKKNLPLNKTVNLAAAAAFGKLQERGDATDNSIETVEFIMQQAIQKETSA
jgi:2-dehydro-3-deoxygluconokinase